MNKLYPLKFKPLFKEKIWGGTRIKDMLGIDFGNLSNCGEAWILSGVKYNETVVTNGFLKGNGINELVEVYMDDLVGEKIFEKHKNEFPILVKLIDSNDYLSIQVHPDDKLAAKRGLGNGKTEMWYILSADPEAELISGFKEKIDQQTYLHHLESNTLKQFLNTEKVMAGNVFFIPAGRIHALGPGILLAEIQQTSDVTYRLYDWDRVDGEGKKRELHTKEAIEAIDFNVYKNYKTQYYEVLNKSVELVSQPFFTTNIIHINQPIKRDYTMLDSLVICTCVQGSSEMIYPDGKVNINIGECVLIPNEIKDILIKPFSDCKILETFII